MKTITVEIPIEDIAERYLKLSGIHYVFGMRHLNRKQTDFYSLELQDYHLPTGEVRIRFTLRNAGNAEQECVLSLADIFEGPQRLEEMRGMLVALMEKQKRSENAGK